MKKTLTIVFLLAFSLNCAGQKIRITDAVNQWVTAGTKGIDGYTFTSYVRYSGDTIISGQTYRRVSTPNNLFIREDTTAEVVYYRNLAYSDTAEHILYDYKLKAGDTINAYNATSPDKVVSMDSIIINGVYHKIFNFQNVAYGYMRSYTVLEGVVGTNNPFFAATFYSCFEFTESLLCFSQGGYYPAITVPINSCAALASKHIFDNPVHGCGTLSIAQSTNTSVTVSPNPASNQIDITAHQFGTNTFCSVYDMSGRCVLREQELQQRKTTINTSFWRDGLYLLVIYDGSGVIQKEKVIIQQ